MSLNILGASEVFERNISPEADMAKIMAGIQMNADKLSYDGSLSKAEAVGNVIIKTDVVTLTADMVTLNVKTGDADAVGNVRLVRGNDSWTGQKLSYNFKTGTVGADSFALSAYPFRVFGDEAARTTEGDFLLDTAVITTCTNDYDHLHYRIVANNVKIIPGDSVRGSNARWYLGKLPVFWWPRFYSPLDSPQGWSFRAGYTSRWGAFLLSSYTFSINSWLESETHFDLRSMRGVGLGQDFRWNINDNGDGEISGYYTHDNDTEAGDHDTEIDPERYRVKFTQDYNFSLNDYFLTKLEYVSDPYLRSDFFEDEYQDSRYPQNYMYYTHRADKWLLTGMVKGKLNDYYSVVARYPEFTLDIMRQELFDSGFYYESTTSSGFLEKQWSEYYKEEKGYSDYSLFRLDTQHFVNYPFVVFSWLNLTPGVSYQGTYYSKTKEEATYVDSSGESHEITVEKDAELRNILEFSLSSSFKAYSSTFYPMENVPMRHLAIPYISYFYRPEPSLLAENIYQFDDIDDIGEANSIKLGMINRLQRGYKFANGKKYIKNLADVNIYTYLNLLEDETTLQYLYLESKFLPINDMIIFLDMTYDVENDYLDDVDLRFSYLPSKVLGVELEYLYEKDDNSTLVMAVDGYLTEEWTVGTYIRYDLEYNNVDETKVYVQQVLDCLGWELGLRYIPGYEEDGDIQEEEWSVIVGFWLTDIEGAGIYGD